MGKNQEDKSMDDAQLKKLDQLNSIPSIYFSFVKEFLFYWNFYPIFNKIVIDRLEVLSILFLFLIYTSVLPTWVHINYSLETIVWAYYIEV